MSFLGNIFIVICILGGLMLILSVFLTPGTPSRSTYMNRGTRFFLIALRLAIGWHFLVEGLDKWNDPDWTSQPYLHAAAGPLGPYFHQVADEPFLEQFAIDEQNLQKLAVLGAGEVGMAGAPPASGPLVASTSLYPGKIKHLPPLLDQRWQRYLEKFKKEFELNDEEAQLAEIRLDQAKARTLLWMATPQPVEKPSPYIGRPADMTIGERVDYYVRLRKKAEDLAEENMTGYGEGNKKKLTDVLTEANQVYAGLKKDLAEQTKAMQKDLQSVLQDPVKRRLQMPKMPPAPFEWQTLQLADIVVRWGLCIVGICLLAGVLTRTNCVLGAGLLLMFFIAMPPLPGLPANPRAEGHYLYINKNIIEMLALLALATTRSGRWLGLDGIFYLVRMTLAARRSPTTEKESRENSVAPSAYR